MHSRILLPAFALLLTTSCLFYVGGGRRDESPATWRVETIEEDASAPVTAGRPELSFSTETFTLPNGMTVVLHEDHSLPMVVVNTWYHVGSKDEKPGRTGFAHMFEHLMFMGTGRVPEGQFDILMESGGGWNNASTSKDKTNYFSEGPSSLLPTLLWLDADRYAELPNYMTLEKLDSQRAVVRNERRQTTENTPYGMAWLMIPEALYPEGHPYHHSVIGSHEDLQAATVEDVVEFFRTYYVPANASLVVAGDFDPVVTRELVKKLMGAVPIAPAPEFTTAAPVVLEHEVRITATDRVQFSQLYLAWHSPRSYAPGDAELGLAGSILAGGPSSRLEKRLVLETGLAQRVRAFQMSGELGSVFQVTALATPGADVDEMKREILAVIEEFQRGGPTAEELTRVKAQREASFLRRIESLGRRADLINAYRRAWGVSDGFQRDLDRWLAPTAKDVRPEDFPPAPFLPPAAESFTLSNGIAVHAVSRPGTRLFAGRLVARGGESLVVPEEAGLSALVARAMNSGAGGRDASEFAAAVESLGASMDARSGRESFTVEVDGLTSRMGETLDLFADLVLRPEMTEADFAREKTLALSAIQARRERVSSVASTVASALAFGREDARGRPPGGYEETVGALGVETARRAHGALLHAGNAVFVFAGDFALDDLHAHLEERFGGWTSEGPAPRVDVARPSALEDPRFVVVDRPGAPQTMIYLMRPVPWLEGPEWTARAGANRVLGVGFTSRLNANLREDKGYTYGARSSISRSATAQWLSASSAVFTEKTGAALTEFKREFDRMATEGVTPEELVKAVESARTRLVEGAATTSSLVRTLATLIATSRPLDATAAELTALSGLTLEATNRHATSDLFAWGSLNVILVGDRSAITEQLTAAGFPVPIAVTPEGDLVE